ncbi:MAG: SdpI family protein [Cyclobacteriaceae bacterium]|nr:SdpI family protein [Cyclobacteriaceae bacterium]UYN87149.1 MAG: SdpI family protein [Cyclobacteriaceae bacterium]
MFIYILLGIVLVVIGLSLKFGRIEKNYFFGYRTPRSMKNKMNWEFANGLMANYSIIVGVLSILSGVIGWYFNLNSKYIIYITVGLMAVCLITTEIRLYKFDKAKRENKG